jgi:hypothetical protein
MALQLAEQTGTGVGSGPYPWTNGQAHQSPRVLLVKTTLIALQMKSRWESNINVWFRLIYFQK